MLHLLIFQITFGPVYLFTDTTKKNKKISFHLPLPINRHFREFTLTWYNNLIQLHYVNEGRLVPILEYRDDQITANNIGCIKFYTSTTTRPTEWLIESKLFYIQSLIKNGAMCMLKKYRKHWLFLHGRICITTQGYLSS